jgi:hypothetical protein
VAVGTQEDVLVRLKRGLPPSWFGPDGEFPVVEALLSGAAWLCAGIYDLYAYAKLQTRIATQTGGWLDLTAADFFDRFVRFTGEHDDSYSRRIRLEVFRDRNTRHAIDRAVYDVIGVHPHIYEGFHAPTCGGWGTPGLALGRAGRWGSRRMVFDVVVVLPLPQNYGIPNRGGWGTIVGGWGIGNLSLVTDRDFTGAGPTRDQIMAAIERVRAAGVTIWVRFTNPIGTGDPEA